MRKLIALILFFACLPFMSPAEKWSAETLPLMQVRRANGYVCNPDGVLSEAAVDSTDAILRSLEADKGVQTVVVAVKQLQGDDPYQFGMDLARKYGIGLKSQNTGLIVILATEDRSYQILTGTGLEGTLPDAICRRIQNRVMKPLLKRQEWDAAIVRTIQSIAGYVRNDPTVKAELQTEDRPMDSVLGFCIAIAFLAALFLLMGRIGTRHWCPRCKKTPMHVVRKQRVKMAGNGQWRIYTTYRCPRCGYEKTEITDDDSFNGGDFVPPVIMGGFGGRGGGFSSPTFGGGSFGGGGSGGRF